MRRSNSASAALFWLFRLTLMNTDRPSPSAGACASATYWRMTPPACSAFTRARQGEGLRCTRRASSTLDSEASRCNSSRMRRSVGSIFISCFGSGNLKQIVLLNGDNAAHIGSTYGTRRPTVTP